MNTSFIPEESAATTLDAIAIGCPATVRHVEVPGGSPEWKRWLEEIGFIPGERVMVMARSLPGGDPLVVRVGQSTFALRRAEAACVQIMPIETTVGRLTTECGILEGGMA